MPGVVLRILTSKGHTDGRDLRLRRFDVHTLLEAAHDRDSRMRLARVQRDRAILLDRNVDLGALAEPKVPRQDSDYGATHGVECQDPAEDVRVGSQPYFPEPVAEHDRAGSALAVFLKHEVAPEERGDTKGWKEARRDVLAREVLGFAGSGEVEVVAADGAHIGEGPAFAAPIEEVRVRDRGIVELLGRLVDRHQPVGVGIRERPQQDAVHHAENGRIRADTQRQRQHRDGGEAGVFPQCPESVAQVLREAAQQTPSASRAQDDGLRRVRTLDGAQFFGQQLMAADLVQRHAACFHLLSPAALQFAVAILGVLGQFLYDLRLTRGSQLQVRQLFADLFFPVRHFQLL